MLSLFLCFFLSSFLTSFFLSLSLWVSDQRCQIGTQFLLQKLANGISKYTSPRCRHIDVQMLKAKGFSISLATYLAALPGQGMQDLGLGLFHFLDETPSKSVQLFGTSSAAALSTVGRGKSATSIFKAFTNFIAITERAVLVRK